MNGSNLFGHRGAAAQLLMGALAAGALLLIPSATPSAGAQTAGLHMTVNSTADAPDANPGDGVCATSSGECTLRAAVQEANAFNRFGPPIPKGNSITLPAGTYTLTEACPLASCRGIPVQSPNPLSITGAGAATTVIDANGAVTKSNAFEIGDVIFDREISGIIRGVTIKNGRIGAEDGGAISVINASLLLEDSVLRDNANTGGGFGGGAIFTLQGSAFPLGVVHTVTIRNTAITHNSAGGPGGGIAANGDVTNNALRLINSTVSNNTAAVGGVAPSLGGGISVAQGVVSLFNTTVDGNTAANGGGGIAVIGSPSDITVTNSTVSGNDGGNGEGGGIDSFNSVLNVVNSTISGNSTNGQGGGIFSSLEDCATCDARVELRNATIANNVASGRANVPGAGGGFANGAVDATGFFLTPGVVNFRNSIIADNTVAGGGTGPDCSAPAAGLNSQGFNLIKVPAGCNLPADATNLTGIDPLLGPLAHNGGPTVNHALLSGSPAINTGNFAVPGSGGNACETTDQRGVARPQNGRCDIGAFELRTG